MPRAAERPLPIQINALRSKATFSLEGQFKRSVKRTKRNDNFLLKIVVSVLK